MSGREPAASEPSTTDLAAGRHAAPPVERAVRGRGLPLFGALRHREYRLLWIGLVVSNVGAWMQMVVLGWLVYTLTDSTFWLGLVGFARAVPVFIFTLWGGVLADRADRRSVMMLANSCVAGCTILLGVLTLAGLVNVYLVLVVAFFTSAAWSFEVPSRQSLVPDLVPRQDMVNAIGLQSAAFNGAGVFGPPIAALLIDQLGIGRSFLINGLFSLAVVGSLVLMQPVKRGSGGAGSALTNLLEGFRYVRRTPAIAALFGMIAITNLTARPFIQLMPAFARDVLEVGASGLGVLMGTFGAGGLIGAIAVANVGSFRHRGRMLIASGLGFSVLVLVFALSRWFGLSALVCLTMGLTQNFFYASGNTMIQLNAPGALRGRLMSMYAFMMMGFMPIGATLLGSVGELAGVERTVALGGLVSALVVLLVAARVPKVRTLE